MSGGENSITLLHLLKQGTESDHKKLLFLPVILWLDEGAALGLDVEQRRKNATEMREILESYGFSYHLARLEDFTSGEVEVTAGREEVKYSESQAQALQASLNSLCEASARQELMLQVSPHKT